MSKKHFGMPTFKQYFHLFYLIAHSISSMKLDIPLNLSLANIHVIVCLLRYLSFSSKQKCVISLFR